MAQEFSGAGAASGAASGAQIGSIIPGVGTLAGGVIGGLAGGFLGAGGSERQSLPAGVEHSQAALERAGQAGGELHVLARDLLGRALEGKLPGNLDALMERLRVGGREQIKRDFPDEQRDALSPLVGMGATSNRIGLVSRKVANQQRIRLSDFELAQVNQRVQQLWQNFQFGVNTGTNILSNLAGQRSSALQESQPTTTFRPSEGQQFLGALAPLAGIAGQFASQRAQDRRADELQTQDRNFLISQQERQQNFFRELLGQAPVQGTG